MWVLDKECVACSLEDVQGLIIDGLEKKEKRRRDREDCCLLLIGERERG